MENIILRELDMPLTVRAFTIPDANGNFNIYININLSDEAKRKSLEHEMLHINNNDFGSDDMARNIEMRLFG